jgi:parallel beta-helix repeat protein
MRMQVSVVIVALVVIIAAVISLGAPLDLKPGDSKLPPDFQPPLTFKPIIPAPTTWSVNSEDGNDVTGTGSTDHPFKTITHALNSAHSGDTIRVEVGLPYDAANGEVFPLGMKRGVDIQGVCIPVINGRIMPVISGGARYDIPESTRGRYVSVLGADDASISGFRFDIINSPGTAAGGNADGTAILCNATSPTIEDNLFSGVGHAGITTLGNAHPIIRDNDFTGSLNWGITVYGESYPTIESNDFSGNNGVDCTDHSHPTIDGNTFTCVSTGISTKGWSDALISNNTITRNGDWGIMVRMDSTPVIQDNIITDNPTGIYIAPGGTLNPDIGGGGRSHGDNEFNNTIWDIENMNPNNIAARNNHWISHCCEDIDARVYDDDEIAVYGAVDFGPCIICRAIMPIKPLP